MGYHIPTGAQALTQELWYTMATNPGLPSSTTTIYSHDPGFIPHIVVLKTDVTYKNYSDATMFLL